MYYIYDEDFKEKHSKEECEKNYKSEMQKMAFLDNKLQSLYEEKRRLENNLKYGLNYEEYSELFNTIERYENAADIHERNADFWEVAIKKFYEKTQGF